MSESQTVSQQLVATTLVFGALRLKMLRLEVYVCVVWGVQGLGSSHPILPHPNASRIQVKACSFQFNPCLGVRDL